MVLISMHLFFSSKQLSKAKFNSFSRWFERRKQFVQRGTLEESESIHSLPEHGTFKRVSIRAEFERRRFIRLGPGEQSVILRSNNNIIRIDVDLQKKQPLLLSRRNHILLITYIKVFSTSD